MAELTTKQAMNIILQKPLWYEGYCNVKTARTILHRHKKGILSDTTYEKILFHFGFKKQITWSI